MSQDVKSGPQPLRRYIPCTALRQVLSFLQSTYCKVVEGWALLVDVTRERTAVND